MTASAAVPEVGGGYRTVDLSVVVCCYTEERWADTLNAVRSVRAQEPAVGQVIVVVDHNDGLFAQLSKTLPDAHVVTNRHQRGLAGARNTGIEESVGSIVAFIDDDAEAEPGWAAALIAGYADPDVLGVGGAVQPRWLAGRPAWFPTEFDWVVGCTYTGSPQVPSVVRNFIGANMSLRRDVLTSIGGFSTSLGRVGKHPAGCEETELCIRATTTFGGVLRHEPAAVVCHSVPAARGRFTYLRQRCHAEGVSKAVVARLAGPTAALSTEREYVRRALPAGIIRGLRAGLAGDGAGLARSGAILFGLSATTVGYVRGQRAARNIQPVTKAPTEPVSGIR